MLASVHATLTDLGPAYVAAAAIIQYSLPRVKGGLPLDGSHDALGRTDYQAPPVFPAALPLSLSPSLILRCTHLHYSRTEAAITIFTRNEAALARLQPYYPSLARSLVISRYQLMRGDASFCKAEIDRTAVSHSLDALLFVFWAINR